MNASIKISQSKESKGFTLVEMLVVIGMIAALAGVSFPVYRSIQSKVEMQQLEMVFGSIERAVENFETEYNYLPYAAAAYPANDEWIRWGDNDIFVGTLMGLESTKNFKRIDFLEIAEAKGSGPHASPGPAGYTDGVVDNGDGTAALYSPSGMKYIFIVDHNLDGEITSVFPGGGVVTDKKIIFWTTLNTVWNNGSTDNWIANYPHT
jgi:prepilin-type N-terminal cleavage/methylation domain-containing protein